MVAREGIEPPTRGFSARFRWFQGFINQPLAASCRPLPRHTKAHSWHTHSELVTFLAQEQRDLNLAISCPYIVRVLWYTPRSQGPQKCAASRNVERTDSRFA